MGHGKAHDMPEMRKAARTAMKCQCGCEFDPDIQFDHILLCGDSTKKSYVDLANHGEKADLCLTDPPYGLGDTKSDKNNYCQYEDTKENLHALIAGFLPLAFETAKVTVLTPGNMNQRMYPPPTWTMAWFVPAGLGCGPWGFCCWQPILCYGKDPKLALGKGSHPDAVVHSETAEKLGHPCSKPVKFWEWLMERASEKGAIIFDPFCGSGTTIIAAANLGRKTRNIELSPCYVAVCLQRYADHTGHDPELINANK